MDRPDLDYAALFDASPNPYLVLDRRLHIVGANRAYLAATGRTLDEIVGRWAWDAFPTDPDTLRLSIDSFERVKATGAPDTLALLRFDIPRSPAQGGGFEERYWSIVASPVPDAAGEVALMLQHPIDVTELQRLRVAESAREPGAAQADGPTPNPGQSGIFERAQALQEANWSLREERERLRLLFEQAPGFMALFRGADHVFELANAAYRDIVGAHRELLGKPLREAQPEVIDQPFPALLDEVWRTGQPFVGRGMRVLLARAPDQPPEERFVDFVYQPILGRDGQAWAIFAQGHDVTEQHRALSALRESDTRERLLLQASSMGTWDWDILAGTVTFSGAAQAIYGFAAPTVAAGVAFDQVHPEDLREVQAAFEAARDPAGTGELRLYHRFRCPRRGTGWVEVIGQAQFADGRDGIRHAVHIVGMAWDVTERERLVADLKLADARKNEFLATLAHELRNPLAPMRNVSHLLRRSPLATAHQPLLDMLDRQIGQMRRLVDDLLEISRITRGKVELQRTGATVGTALHAALEAVSPVAAERAQRFDVRARSSALVQIDAARITQVMTNLLHNAVKFSPMGSTIVLESFDEPEAVVLRVADQGIGIAPDLLPRVFELFSQGAATTGDQAQAGLGIGLSLVDRLVAMHGGSVQAESAGLGQGATFTVRLPRP